MLSEPAVVTASQDGHLLLQADRARTCTKCSLKRGCGQYLLADARAVTLSLQTEASTLLCTGDQVHLAMPGRSLLQLVARFYLPPLLLLPGAALLGWRLGLSELLQVFCAVLGLGLGIACSRILLRGHAPPLRIISAVAPHATVPVPSGVSLS